MSIVYIFGEGHTPPPPILFCWALKFPPGAFPVGTLVMFIFWPLPQQGYQLGHLPWKLEKSPPFYPTAVPGYREPVGRRQMGKAMSFITQKVQHFPLSLHPQDTQETQPPFSQRPRNPGSQPTPPPQPGGSPSDSGPEPMFPSAFKTQQLGPDFSHSSLSLLQETTLWMKLVPR